MHCVAKQCVDCALLGPPAAGNDPIPGSSQFMADKPTSVAHVELVLLVWAVGPWQSRLLFFSDSNASSGQLLQRQSKLPQISSNLSVSVTSFSHLILFENTHDHMNNQPNLSSSTAAAGTPQATEAAFLGS
jgi:hypothetical protein